MQGPASIFGVVGFAASKRVGQAIELQIDVAHLESCGGSRAAGCSSTTCHLRCAGRQVVHQRAPLHPCCYLELRSGLLRRWNCVGCSGYPELTVGELALTPKPQTLTSPRTCPIYDHPTSTVAHSVQLRPHWRLAPFSLAKARSYHLCRGCQSIPAVYAVAVCLN